MCTVWRIHVSCAYKYSVFFGRRMRTEMGGGRRARSPASQSVALSCAHNRHDCRLDLDELQRFCAAPLQLQLHSRHSRVECTRWLYRRGPVPVNSCRQAVHVTVQRLARAGVAVHAVHRVPQECVSDQCMELASPRTTPTHPSVYSGGWCDASRRQLDLSM